MEFLYGLVLFAVMSTTKRDRPIEEFDPEPAYIPRVAHVTKSETRTDTSSRGSNKDDANGEKKRGKKGQDSSSTPGLTNLSKSSLAEEKEKEKEKVKTDDPKPAAKKPAKKPSKKPKKPNANSKKALALNSNAKGEAAPTPVVPKDIPTIPPLGFLIDPMLDSTARKDDEGLTITVPPGLHIFKGNVVNAARALTDVTGDFVAEVKISGELRPGTTPVENLPFVFQAAGLLLWQDKDNYVRLERMALYTGERFHKVFVESCKDGKVGKSQDRNVRDGVIRLRLQRRGSELAYSFSPDDGKTWLKLAPTSVAFPAKVSVGISASSASPRKLDARFEGFSLKPSSCRHPRQLADDLGPPIDQAGGVASWNRTGGSSCTAFRNACSQCTLMAIRSGSLSMNRF